MTPEDKAILLRNGMCALVKATGQVHALTDDMGPKFFPRFVLDDGSMVNADEIEVVGSAVYSVVFDNYEMQLFMEVAQTWPAARKALLDWLLIVYGSMEQLAEVVDRDDSVPELPLTLDAGWVQPWNDDPNYYVIRDWPGADYNVHVRRWYPKVEHA